MKKLTFGLFVVILFSSCMAFHAGSISSNGALSSANFEYVKKDISVIKNNHLKHMSVDINRIGKKVDRILWSMITGMGALILTLIALVLK